MFVLDTPFRQSTHATELAAYRELVDIVVPSDQCDSLRDALLMSLQSGGRFFQNAVESLERLAWFIFFVRTLPEPGGVALLPDDYGHRELTIRH